jgi:hypothetical protein
MLLEAELQAIHDLNRTTYEPQQTVLSNNEPTVNHTSDVEPGPSSSNSTLPTQEQPTTTNIDTGAIAHNTLRISNRGAKSNSNDKLTMQQLIVITLRKMVQNTELTIPMMDIQERKINPTPLQQNIQYGSAQSVENRLKLISSIVLVLTITFFGLVSSVVGMLFVVVSMLLSSTSSPLWYNSVSSFISFIHLQLLQLYSKSLLMACVLYLDTVIFSHL